MARVIEGVAPDEIYNLSGQSSVSLSFTQPAETLAGIALGRLNMLETLRRFGAKVRFYNAGSSECFGDTGTRAANEHDPPPLKAPGKLAILRLPLTFWLHLRRCAATGISPGQKPDEPDESYDAADDFAGSLNDCYRAIRERVAAGGKEWEPR